jgi:hypothetical protein
LIIRLITIYLRKMAILKADKVNKQGNLVGGYVGDRIFNYLSLYCVARNTLKSRIFIKLLLEWISVQKTMFTEPKLIRMITENIRAERKRKAYRDMDLDEFREKIEAELLKKGIAIDIVAKILLEIE